MHLTFRHAIWTLITAVGLIGGTVALLSRSPEPPAGQSAAPAKDAVGGKPAQTTAKAKPICASPVNPNVAAPTDCIPQHLANLPPDPGEAGKATIDGIDADKDGMRDDVQRWIALEWGHSPIAVKALTALAQVKQIEVHYGDDLGKEETRKRLGPETERKIICYSRLETPALLEGRAAAKLREVVLNTPERRQRSHDFDYLFAHGVYISPNLTTNEACGFDAEALAAQTGEQTISAQLLAESIERTKREQQEEAEAIERANKELKK